MISFPPGEMLLMTLEKEEKILNRLIEDSLRYCFELRTSFVFCLRTVFLFFKQRNQFNRKDSTDRSSGKRTIGKKRFLSSKETNDLFDRPMKFIDELFSRPVRNEEISFSLFFFFSLSIFFFFRQRRVMTGIRC